MGFLSRLTTTAWRIAPAESPESPRRLDAAWMTAAGRHHRRDTKELRRRDSSPLSLNFLGSSDRRFYKIGFPEHSPSSMVRFFIKKDGSKKDASVLKELKNDTIF